MFILGISSTTKIISVALVECRAQKGLRVMPETTVCAEFNLSGSTARAENITYFVEKMLSRAKFDIHKIDAVAVCDGPGSYGGIRGGVTFAKTFAQALNLPVLGVSTLDAMAFNFIGGGKVAMVVLDAKIDEYNLAVFSFNREGLIKLTDDFVIAKNKLIEKIGLVDGPMIIAGTVGELGLPTEILAKENLAFVPFTHCWPRASNVAWLAAGRLAADTALSSFESAQKLRPRYSHQPNIRTFSSPRKKSK